jgi:hypothetical protein
MSDEPIPEDVRQFILAHIDSIAQLEALQLLRREPGGGWTIGAIAQRLYIEETQAREALEGLRTARLVTATDDIFRFSADSAELAALADRLIALYALHLIPVTNLVHGKPRVRAFADAFKFRRDR